MENKIKKYNEYKPNMDLVEKMAQLDEYLDSLGTSFESNVNVNVSEEFNMEIE